MADDCARHTTAAVPLLCVAAAAWIVLSASAPGLARRPAGLRSAKERRLTEFGSPEDKQREYRQGLRYGGEAPPQVVHPFVPSGQQAMAGSFGAANPATVGAPENPVAGFFDRLFGVSGFLLFGQAIFSIVYYWLVVRHYPYWSSPTPASSHLQSHFAPLATVHTSYTNCILSWCCPQARASHTFSRTGTLDYWFSCLAMFFCPFCTLCYFNACTDLNAKLGGERVNIIWSAISTWLCSCCVIAQDAESLDAATGARTEFCGVGPGQGGMHGPMQPMPMASGTSVPTGTPGTPMHSGPMGSGTAFLGTGGSGPMGSASPMMGSGPPMVSSAMGSLGSRTGFGSPGTQGFGSPGSMLGSSQPRF